MSRATTGWKCLKLTISGPIYCRYGYHRLDERTFVITAEGDLDGDGVTSKVLRRGVVTEQGTVKTTDPIVENELE